MAVDESAWDGNRALGECSTASDYRSICAGEKTVGESDQRQHWALPHHYLGKGPNAAGVRNALARLPQTQNLKDEGAARRHLEGHMGEINPDRGAFPRENLIRMVAAGPRTNVYTWPEHRSAGLLPEPNVMVGYMMVFDAWADIDTWEGRFRERFLRSAFDKTLRESGDKVKVLFNHGFDHWIGENVLGVPRALKPGRTGLWAEVPLLDTDYNRERIRPQLEGGAIEGQSIQFSVVQDSWNHDTEDGIPERSVIEAKLFEGGPVTWPAYEATTVGVRTAAQFDLWRSTHEAVPPSQGRSTDKAAAPDDEGRDTSALTLARARNVTLARELDEEARRMQWLGSQR